MKPRSFCVGSPTTFGCPGAKISVRNHDSETGDCSVCGGVVMLARPLSHADLAAILHAKTEPVDPADWEAA